MAKRLRYPVVMGSIAVLFSLVTQLANGAPQQAPRYSFPGLAAYGPVSAMPPVARLPARSGYRFRPMVRRPAAGRLPQVVSRRYAPLASYPYHRNFSAVAPRYPGMARDAGRQQMAGYRFRPLSASVRHNPIVYSAPRLYPRAGWRLPRPIDGPVVAAGAYPRHQQHPLAGAVMDWRQMPPRYPPVAMSGPRSPAVLPPPMPNARTAFRPAPMPATWNRHLLQSRSNRMRPVSVPGYRFRPLTPAVAGVQKLRGRPIGPARVRYPYSPSPSYRFRPDPRFVMNPATAAPPAFPAFRKMAPTTTRVDGVHRWPVQAFSWRPLRQQQKRVSTLQEKALRDGADWLSQNTYGQQRYLGNLAYNIR